MPFGSEQWMYASGGFYPHEIDNSARLDTNSYYTRTPSSASNRTTWTWSGWVKMPPASSQYTLFFAEPAVTDYAGIIITAGSQLQLINRPTTGVNASLISTQVFRDPSAWYHLVGVWDTTNSTQADRVRLYVNGERVTSFSTSTLPAQNAVSAINSTGLHEIGATVVASGGANNFYNGYITEVNFVDGQALDPTSFGEFKSGVWIPKSYSGTYGTNGFYLDFATRATDPIDASGNGNNWGSVNVVSTDWMLDSPTNNFATLNPADKSSALTMNEGNLRIAHTSGVGIWDRSRGTMGVSSGKWYWEVLYLSGGYVLHGIDVPETKIGDNTYPGSAADSYGYYSINGDLINNDPGVSYGATYAGGDLTGAALDLDAGTLTFYKNGVSQGVAATGLTADVYVPTTGVLSAGVAVNNFGQDSSFAGNKTAQGNTDANGIGDFYYAPPAGYLALCTANLPNPAINPAQDDVPADYFNTVLYQGDGTSPRSVTGIGFQPDFVWMKSRTDVLVHGLYDAVRGPAKLLISNLTTAEVANDPYGYISSYDTDGFTLTAGTISNDTFNRGTDAYVSWNWLAGNGTTSNTDGTITSTVSANQKAGFSIVSYTGSGTGGATIGHGLSSTPKFVVVKRRDSADGWFVYWDDFGGTDYLVLSSANAKATNSTVWNNTSATSSVFSVGTNGGVNASAGTYIAYCFNSVEGFSKFGSYTGNGSTDGPFVYTGFRPAFVIVKRTDVAGAGWIMLDTGRDTFNTLDSYLVANSSNSEGTLSLLDFLSNGLKPRSIDGGVNGGGNTYIYMAFAEMPFKYSNAR